ncbi:5232_t:CDS:2 [Funneliformis geosporum]|nr:5232_t:CDS:2 [Funneliformis geosporum]
MADWIRANNNKGFIRVPKIVENVSSAARKQGNFEEIGSSNEIRDDYSQTLYHRWDGFENMKIISLVVEINRIHREYIVMPMILSYQEHSSFSSIPPSGWYCPTTENVLTTLSNLSN